MLLLFVAYPCILSARCHISLYVRTFHVCFLYGCISFYQIWTPCCFLNLL